MEWLLDQWLPIGHRLEDAAPEGGCKTIWGCWLSVCVASGNSVFNHKVRKGPVIIIDEETPLADLERHLNRFSQYFNYHGYHELPITVVHRTGFQFDRKVDLNKILTIVQNQKPVLVRLDSLIAMLPLGRQGINENSSQLGGIIGRDLNEITKVAKCCTLLAVHAKKPIADLTLEEIQTKEMQSIVRGHGSIVGEGCDTGFIIKKISERPCRFAIITRSRRSPTMMVDKTVYVEMEEEFYGTGWAGLKEIPAAMIPPSKFAKDMYKALKDGAVHKAPDLVRELALFTKKECSVGISELIKHQIISEGNKPQTYLLNPNRASKCTPEYLKALEL